MDRNSTRYSLAEARAAFANLLARASLGGERFRLARRAIDVAAVLGPRDLGELSRLDEQEGRAATWNPEVLDSPRSAREQLADVLAGVEAGERVAIEKRGRLYAALVPITDLDRLGRQFPATGSQTIEALADTRQVTSRGPSAEPAVVTAILVPKDGSPLIFPELKVWPDEADSSNQRSVEVRCRGTRPSNHDDIAEAMRSAAREHHQRGGRLPTGFTYEIDMGRSRAPDGLSLATVNLDVTGASVQAPAFIAAAFALFGRPDPEILATGSLQGGDLGSVDGKLQAAVDRGIQTLVIPAEDLPKLTPAFAAMGWAWSEHARLGKNSNSYLKVLSFSSVAELYDLAVQLSGTTAVTGRVTTSPLGTIGSLWEEAFGSDPGALEQAFLAHLRDRPEASPHRGPPLDAPLTPLQRKFLEQCQGADAETPFTSDRHLLISGGTSSGKTTLLEILAVATAFPGGDRGRALYVAPTRALAQIKFAELQERYGSFDAFGRRPIILATGEDNEDDWRFRNGEFGIAICVYEKANVLAQVQRKLIDQIGLVVIDEAHMLSDPDRGPILEMFLLKVLLRRAEQEESGENRERKKLRVAVVSTEAIEMGLNSSHPIISLLTETRRMTKEKRPPWVVAQPHRPGTIVHKLVMSTLTPPGYTLVDIAKFEDAKTRTLSAEQLKAVELKIMQAEREYTPEKGLRQLGRLLHASKSEPATRLHGVLRALARDNAAVPRRILIFMPSVASIISFANRFKKSLPPDREVDPGLQERFDGLDDEAEKRHFEQLAKAGIFIHHAGVDRALRDKIAELWARRANGCGAEFLFATETLSFGVNLAIDDVIMYGTSIYSNARNRNKEGAASPYTSCEFHNMIGRAARLGRRPDDLPAGVYTLPHEDFPARDIIRRYYVNVPGLESRLFVEDDVVREGRGDVAKRLDNISHPFVHAMLDLLRFVARDDEGAALIDDLVERLEQGSLFCRQLSQTPRAEDVRRALRASLEAVMDGCASEGEAAFRLVERTVVGRSFQYRITQKGRDVLDTGTEIQTLQPLVKLASLIEEAVWKHGKLDHQPMPGQLAILAVIAQRECYRPAQRAVPESQIDLGSNLADENSVGVSNDFANIFLKHVPGATETMPKRLGEVLHDFFRDMNIPAPELRRDAVLRLGAMMMLWVDGRPLPEVRAPAETLYPRRDRRQFTINVQSYTDRLAWKLELLMRLLAPRHEIQLVDTIDRVRFGGPTDAVMLLKALRTLRRTRAARMLPNSAPDLLLRRFNQRTDLSLKDELELRRGLRRGAIDQFAELAAALCSRTGTNASSYVKAIEEYGEKYFSLDVNAYSGDTSFLLPRQIADAQDAASAAPAVLPPDQEMGSFEETSESVILWSGRGGQRTLSLDLCENGGFWLQDRGGEQDLDSRMLVVGARSDWMVQSDKDAQLRPFAEILAAEHEAERLILGISPWLPHPGDWPNAVIEQLKARNAAGRETLFLTAPGLCTLLVMLTRNFGSPDELLYASLLPGKVSVQTVHDLHDRLIDNPELPGAIRRAMAKFKEVGMSLPESLG
jgi:antitoxin (DNA-binding transcriptional repressor) of toxin-antitoxin stability system